MTMKFRMGIYMNRLLSDLYDACTEFISEGGSLTNVYLVLPSLLSLKLDSDFRLSIPESISMIHIETAFGNIDFTAPNIELSMGLPFIPDPPYPGSQNWTFLDPSDWTFKSGSAHSTTRYYTVGDSAFDLLCAVIVYKIIFGLIHLGLGALVMKFSAKALLKGYVHVDKVAEILSVANNINDKIGNPGSGQSIVSKLLGISVQIQNMSDTELTSLDGKLDEIMLEIGTGDVETLDQKVSRSTYV